MTSSHWDPLRLTNLATCLQLCPDLGLSLHPDKLEGPTTCLTMLAIELDSSKLKVLLPQQKRTLTISLLEVWYQEQFSKRERLESFVAHLHLACKINPQGRTFHRDMINPCVYSGVMAIPSDLTGNFGLTCCGGRSCSGSKPIPYPYVGSYSRLSSDAVGFFGYGAVSLVFWLMVGISGPFVHCLQRAFCGGCGCSLMGPHLGFFESGVSV